MCQEEVQSGSLGRYFTDCSCKPLTMCYPCAHNAALQRQADRQRGGDQCSGPLACPTCRSEVFAVGTRRSSITTTSPCSSLTITSTPTPTLTLCPRPCPRLRPRPQPCPRPRPRTGPTLNLIIAPSRLRRGDGHLLAKVSYPYSLSLADLRRAVKGLRGNPHFDGWARAWLAPQPRDIAAEEAHERAQVLGWLEQLGVVARLATTEDCWLLARLVAAGSREAAESAGAAALASPVPPALPSGGAVQPVLTRRALALRQISDYTAAFVEPAVRTRRAPSSGAAADVARRRVAVAGRTSDLVQHGFGALATACALDGPLTTRDGSTIAAGRPWAHEAASYALCRLVDEGAAHPELWGKLLVPELGGAVYHRFLRCYQPSEHDGRHPREAWAALSASKKLKVFGESS